MVEHVDLLSDLKRVQKGLFDGFERELTTPNTLLITRSSVLEARAVEAACDKIIFIGIRIF